MKTKLRNRMFFLGGTAAVLVFVLGVSWAKNMNKDVPANVTTGKTDIRADSLIKAMSTYMGNLNQFTVTTERTVEVTLQSGQKIQYANIGKVYVKRPDMLRVDFTGDPMNPMWIIPDSTRKPMDVSVYYKRNLLSVFEKNRNEYASATVPTMIDSMIDYAWNCFDIEAPAADLLFKDSYTGLMDGVTSSINLGIAEIDSTPCYHLAFSKPDVDWQIWIEKSSTPLPRKYIITSKKEKGSPDFEIKLRNWDVSTKLSDSSFVFNPPPAANKTEFRSKKCKELQK